ncbi:uncharacterized protein At4g06744-like [Phoenix dactylifera]|uniref:Uncharacterized protein At4g06744-like n=1 Tax=Phoenix dactylifera TaxID=42345 RepID=A0A8B7CCT1_PHODC|nr:uncharacterized protein At4g06744-like [Phoenix dactylifera]
MGGSRSSYSSTLFTSLLLLLLLPPAAAASVLSLSNNSLPTLLHSNSREAIEIGIGIGIGGGGSPPPESEPICPPPPPPPPCPPPPLPPPPPPPPKPVGPGPSDFENILLYRAYFVIQRFRKTITDDPKGISKSWRGYDICHKHTQDTYKGFFCGIPPTRKTMRNVASIDFNGYNLGAETLQGFIDRMPDLAIFHANSNNFSGTVPDLSKLRFLYELDFSNNKLTGSFPINVLPLLANISFLDLRFNQFFGTVPPSVFGIKLDVLFINNNNFTQALPDDLGSTNASYLTLANNGFTGPIPASIGKACNTLMEVLLLNNSLSGCLPYQVGLLKKATVFDAGTNQITGPIPLSFGCLLKVEQLNLARNLLYGKVPDVVCRLADYGHLANLSLSSNYFTRLGFSCWELIDRGILDVRHNCIPGLPDQRSPEECAWFLKQPKYCPVLPYIPCYIPWMHGGGVPSATAMLPAVNGGWDTSPASRYPSYSALLNVHGP